jgi:hypothetical protein
MSIGRQGGMDITVSTPYPIGQWFHFALVREGTGVGQTKVYFDGVLVATGQISNTFSAGVVGLGSTQTGGQAITGYISGWRLLSGTALYTSSFTPPTTPPTAIANTTLLLNFTNAGIIDQTGQNNLITSGNAKISTAVKKYNTGSIYFDGTGDWLQGVASGQNTFNMNFTIEFWVYANSLSGQMGMVCVNNATTSGADGIAIYFDTGNKISFWVRGSGGATITTTTYTTGVWYHIALVRNGSTNTLYVDGVSRATNTDTPTSSYSPIIGVGRLYNDNASGSLNGYIDDLRITKGYARYTTTFTAPTSALLTK